MSEREVILITGGTGKIGSCFVRHFHAKGDVVIYTGRTEDELQELQSLGDGVCGIAVDFHKGNPVEAIVSVLEKHNLKVTALVNAARDLSTLAVGEDGEISKENWLGEYDVDVVFPYQLTRALAKTHPLKTVVNISSMYGMNSFNPHLYAGEFHPVLQYACAKAALIHLTKCLAVCLADKKIMVNCITYGGVEGRVDDAFKSRYANLCPLGRMMKPEEAVPALDFLIHGNSQYMTGQNIIVDGGWSAW